MRKHILRKVWCIMKSLTKKCPIDVDTLIATFDYFADMYDMWIIDKIVTVRYAKNDKNT